MTEHFIGLSAVVVLGIFAQWLAWSLRLPSILLLLVFGVIAGPITGLINPDHLFGNLLFPLVSLSVAVILYEGGLTLRFKELPKIGGAVFSLISVGMLVTWFIATYAAYTVLKLDFSLAVLLGAILTVSGPTVITPLLRHVRPKIPLGSILKWEGILIDPIGAILAVLVFEAIVSGKFHSAPTVILYGTFQTLLIGFVLGLIGAYLMIVLLKNFWVPDYLQNPVSLMILVAVFTLSNVLHNESGLLAVTIMGIVLANWTSVTVQHILEFKENLRVLLISSLFIILAARLRPEDLPPLNLASFAFLGILILFARPATVMVSTALTRFNFKEKLFLAWVAPRGIVAAAVSSLFALELAHIGFEGAEKLVSYTFFVIIGTVAIYGLSASKVAELLGVKQQKPQGILIVGAHLFARAISKELNEQGYKTLMVDANVSNVLDARLEGLRSFHGNILGEHILDELELDGIGKMLALTPNDDANALAALHSADLFGRSEVYQLRPTDVASDGGDTERPQHLRGRLLFSEMADYPFLEYQMAKGAQVKTTEFTDQFNFDDFQSKHGEQAIPLFLIGQDGALTVCTEESSFRPRRGRKLIYLLSRKEA